MDLKKSISKRKYSLLGFLTFIVVTGVNIVSHTPMIYLLTVAALIATAYSARKFSDQFDVKLLFRRRNDSLNYWGSALSGVFAFLVTLYVENMKAPFTEKVAMIAAIMVLAVLMSILFYASILSDIKDGELEIGE